MKRLLYSTIILLLLVSSCKKDSVNGKDTQEALETQEVKFDIGFTQTTGEVETVHTNATETTATDTSLTNHIGVIYYMIFNSEGISVHDITQKSTDTSFGHYTDNLHAGTYTVVIIAGNTALKLYKTGKLSSQFVYGALNSEVYYKTLSITVAHSAIAKSVSLDRVSSKLNVNIKDAIPSGANYASIALQNTGSTVYANTGIPGAREAEAPPIATFPITKTGVKNFKMTLVYIYKTPFRVTLTVGARTGSTDKIFSQKTISNVPGKKNSITTLSGNLFGTSGTNTSNGNIQVAVDTTWNAPINRGF